MSWKADNCAPTRPTSVSGNLWRWNKGKDAGGMGREGGEQFLSDVVSAQEDRERPHKR